MENKRLKHKKIVVLAGGPSKEAEVSKMSALSVAEALKNLGYNFEMLNPGDNFCEDLKRIKPGVVFNCLHGRYGEDGAVQGVLEYLRIPYTHSGIFAASACFNKQKAYAFLKHVGINTIDTQVLPITQLQECLAKGKHPHAVPYVIKPVDEGSAIGVYIVKSENTFPNLSDWSHGEYAIVQEYIPGKELTCTVFNDEPTVVTELRPKGEFYNYEAKYTQGVTQHILPAQIPNEVAELCGKYALCAHKELGLRTLSRSDFRYDPNRKNGLYFLEINSHPGFTKISLVPEALQYSGISFEEVVQKLLEDARLEIDAAGDANSAELNVDGTKLESKVKVNEA